MTFMDLSDLADRANTDPEFKIESRFWTGTIQLAIGDELFVLKVVDGVVQPQHAPRDANDWPFALNYDIRVSGPVEEWEKFFAPNPAPFYHELFAVTTRQNISWGGDVEMWFAYYPAIRRLFALMREIKNADVKKSEVGV